MHPDHRQQCYHHWSALLDALPHPAAAFLSENGSVILANRHFKKQFGLPAEEKKTASPSTTNTNARPQADPPNADTGKGAHIAVLADGFIQLTTPSGAQPPVPASVKPLQVDGLCCQLATVPEPAGQHGAQNGNGSGNNPYRELVENLNDIIYTTDENATVTYVSPNIKQLSGYEAREVIGRNFVEFVHPDDLKGRIEQFMKILGGETQATEYRMLVKNGETRWARTSARPIIRNGSVVGLQGILVDITDKKETEEALRRSEERYRILVQHAKDAIFVLQGERIKFMNPIAVEIMGYTNARIADRPFIDFVHPDDRERIMDLYIRRLKGEDLPDRVAFRIIVKEGEVRDVDLNSALSKWDGKPAVLNFLRDVTIQKKMETQLQNSQKMEALGTLAGGIAHNFNNLLMGIHSNASLCLMKGNFSPSENKYMDTISKLVQSGSRLTNQLLDYARGRTCELNSVDLNNLIGNVSETLSATKKQIRIRHRLDQNIPCITADRGQIEQILLNLLLNANDAMPDGGDIVIETAFVSGTGAKKIHSDLANTNDYVRLKVSDTGIGIPRKIRNRIFEPFFTTKGLGNGTGLGLSTAYGIAKNHRGTITVESKAGKGAAFYVYLPATQDAGHTPAERVVYKTALGEGTILLVDDELSVIESSSELLELLGFSIIKASNGSEALDLFRKHRQRIDLVLLDLILPRISGIDLYDKLKAVDPRVKVLLSSGYSLAGQAEDLLHRGCHGFIQKPYDIHQLASKIMDILSSD